MFYISVCLTIVLLFVFVGIIPVSRALTSLDGRIAETKAKIQEQEALRSIRDTLQKGVQKQGTTLLPLPTSITLKRTEAGLIPGMIRSVSGRSNLELVSVTPDLSALASGASLLPVSLSLRGDFFRFRNFLSSMGGAPYLDFIEEMEIKRGKGTMEYQLRVLLHVGS